MKKKMIIILISIITSIMLMSGGYSLWYEKLTVKGTIIIGHKNGDYNENDGD